MSSPTVGKGGRRKDASFREAAIVEVNTVKEKHTQKVRETMIDVLPEQRSDSDAAGHKCLQILKRSTCEALMLMITMS